MADWPAQEIETAGEEWGKMLEQVSVFCGLLNRHSWKDAENARELAICHMESSLDAMNRAHRGMAAFIARQG